MAKQSRDFLNSSNGRVAPPNEAEFHGNALRDTDVSNGHDYTPGATGRNKYLRGKGTLFDILTEDPGTRGIAGVAGLLGLRRQELSRPSYERIRH